MPAALVMLEVLPAETPATALLVTSHGAKSRPASAGSPATSLVWLDRAEMLEIRSDLHPTTGTAAYVFGERHLVRTATELLVAGGLDRDAVASKAYWRRDQPNASHGEPSFNRSWAPVPPVSARRHTSPKQLKLTARADKPQRDHNPRRTPPAVAPSSWAC
jgi:hypothetical protein